ncbi:probable L-type lectin-domain containing receptor kinase S.5 [Actinidia eriantha]|uniref:probable L-type lectin-domain containing receptor kinase S.5 n=1 Tax=Actinidia eriantha TaxID=165200 RepID=UPI0025899DFA|nr:probable L-type lectin-domain containing receptor kinase S.5 [Actinidia eriantha]
MGLSAKLGTAVVLLCLWAAPPCAAGGLKTFTRTFGPFTEDPYYKIFAVKEPASINNDALQITPDSANQGFKFTNQNGRVMYKKRFKLWVGPNGSESARVGSFNTSFIVNLSPVNNNSVTGEGMAFVVAPDLDLTPGSDGQYLGLTNLTTDGNDTNHLVAVELDTFKQEFDPDSNHIGLNINSVISNATASLTPLGIKLMSEGTEPVFYNIWVQYDGINKSIKVYIAKTATLFLPGPTPGPTPPRPENPVLRSHLDLSRVVNQYSYFGFSASTSNATQLNCVLRWNLTVEYFPEKKFPLVTVAVAAGVPTLAVVAAAVVLGFFLRKRRIIRSNSSILGALKSLPGTPREFQFKDLKKATNKFDERNKLGQGGYGEVYRGFLQSENLEVAVKRFSRESIKGQDDFLAELTIINRLRHKHLVRLLGWCYKNGKLLLVYDYMPNGSLDKHLFHEADSKPLSWTLRYKIISGLAAALHYLHNEYDQRVVHRDLKASNIMLDSDFNARLGDFGLARALDNEKTSYAEAEGVIGTLGYIAPECFHTGKATQQSDVYAFGAVLLEVVCGLRPGTQIGRFQFLVDWVWALHREGHLLEAVDGRLGDDYVVEEAQRVLLLGLACSHPMASERPKTQTIVQVLSGSLPGPNVAPFKPAFIWPSMPMGEEDISQVTMTDTKSFPTSHFGPPWTPQCISRETYAPYSDRSNLA